MNKNCFKPVFSCSGDFYGVPYAKNDFYGNQTMLSFGHNHKELFFYEETYKYPEKMWGKYEKTAISGTFPLLQAVKNFFSENGFQYLFGGTNRHLCAKNNKKLMIKSRENPKKPLFSGHFRSWWPEIIFFQKSGSVTF